MSDLELVLILSVIAAAGLALYARAWSHDAIVAKMFSDAYFETFNRLADDDRVPVELLKKLLVFGRRARDPLSPILFLVAIATVKPTTKSDFSVFMNHFPKELQQKVVLTFLTGVLTISYNSPIIGRVMRWVVVRQINQKVGDPKTLERSTTDIVKRHDPHIDGFASALC